MSELQSYYDDFRRGHWAEKNAAECLCHGNGWALSDVDTWHECPIHFAGQLHPESFPDNVEDFYAADLESRTEWAVKTGRAMLIAGPKVEETKVVTEDDEIPF